MLTDPDPDPGLFVSDSQDANKNYPYLFRLILSVDTYISIFLVYGSKDPDPVPDSALFVSDSQDANKK